jgi:integrase
MGWTTKTDAGRWKAAYRDPARKIRSKTFDRKVDAERWIRSMESSIDVGAYVDPAAGRMPLATFFERYLASAVHLRPKTRETYASIAKIHIVPQLGWRPIAQISRLDVETWLAGLIQAGASPARAAGAHRVLRLVLAAAERGDLIARNPARGVKPPKAQLREMRFLSPAEIDRVAEAVPEPYRALIYLLAYSGMRIGEAIALRIGNLDLLRGRVQIVEAASEISNGLVFGPTKTGHGRAVALPQLVRAELERHVVDHPPIAELVFTNSHGEPLRQTNFNRRVWTPAVLDAGLQEPLPRVHDLRHTAAALAVAAGAHPKEIQARLGHSSITVTLDRYGHVFPTLDERLADRLDELAAGTALEPNAALLPLISPNIGQGE